MDTLEGCTERCESFIYREIGESLLCVRKCEDDEFGYENTLRDKYQYQCVSECEDQMFVDGGVDDVSLRVCQSKDGCERFVKESVTIIGKDAQEEYHHCYW